MKDSCMDMNEMINDVFKIVLNILLIAIAAGAIVSGISEDIEVGLRFRRFALTFACVASVLSKKYRYIFASIALLLIVISYFL